LKFESISLDGQHGYLEHLRHSGITASDYSFVNLWGWASEYGLSWAWEGGLVWIRQENPDPCLWAPVGRWEGVSWPEVLAHPDLQGLDFKRIPEGLLSRWEAALPGRVLPEEAREHWDYLYSVPELIDLSGNRFHSKKNLLKQFMKRYPFRYQPIGPADVRAVLSLQDDWCAWRDCESTETLASENRVISQVMKSWEHLEGIMGAVILVGERPAAFTVAEAYHKDMLLIHFEKGLGEYTGIYQAINQQFLEHNRARGFSLVNREQDLGDEGLRKAKMSYNPADFVRKYRVRITQGT
jgi:hypothetical protein